MGSPLGAHFALSLRSGLRVYRSQFTKLGMTSMGRLMSKSRTVCQGDSGDATLRAVGRDARCAVDGARAVVAI